MTGSAVLPSLVLASGSAARRTLLIAAGVTFRVEIPEVDEPVIRAALRLEDPDVGGAHVARFLAGEKAISVSRKFPDALVIGADQVLEAGREIFSKPVDLNEAQAQLKTLSGRTHRLLSAVSLAQNGKQVWQNLEVATLAMRDLSDEFIRDYLVQAGDSVLFSVGAYEMEGLGIQLFDRIEGDYFTILGLPLLPLLAELRARGQVRT